MQFPASSNEQCGNDGKKDTRLIFLKCGFLNEMVKAGSIKSSGHLRACRKCPKTKWQRIGDGYRIRRHAMGLAPQLMLFVKAQYASSLEVSIL